MIRPLSYRLACVFALGAATYSAEAAEGGATLYLLGSGGPGTAIQPPIEGVFFANTLYHYDANAGGTLRFTLGGNLVVGVEANVLANFATVLWVPTTDLAGGTLGMGIALPYGNVDVAVSAVLTGPGGNSFSFGRADSAFVMGDPVFTATLGWASGNWHYQISTLVNIPIGEYREGQLANLAFHRWALDLSGALSWHDADAGWDVSTKAGFTLNGTNDVTDYTSGTDFHLEGSIEKILSPQWSLGVQAYYYRQVSGDTGAGAVLGSNEGEVTGFGVTGAFNFEVAHNPVSLRAHALWESNATRRLEGMSLFLDLTFPLHLNLPPGAGG